MPFPTPFSAHISEPTVGPLRSRLDCCLCEAFLIFQLEITYTFSIPKAVYLCSKVWQKGYVWVFRSAQGRSGEFHSLLYPKYSGRNLAHGRFWVDEQVNHGVCSLRFSGIITCKCLGQSKCHILALFPFVLFFMATVSFSCSYFWHLLGEGREISLLSTYCHQVRHWTSP